MRPPPAAQLDGSRTNRPRLAVAGRLRRTAAVRAPVFIGSAFVAQYPSGGGMYWIPLQYVRGLRELGHDAYWLELFWTRGDPVVDRQYVDTFLGFARELGVGDRVALIYFPEGTRDEPPGRGE